MRRVSDEGVKMDQTVQRPVGRRINWISVVTVLSAATLIGAEVFGAAYAGGWAVANLLGLEKFGYVLQVLFFLIGLVVMAGFVRNARRVEPFVGKR
jgi:membrane protein implicated in regulation of membrane protease activity